MIGALPLSKIITGELSTAAVEGVASALRFGIVTERLRVPWKTAASGATDGGAAKTPRNCARAVPSAAPVEGSTTANRRQRTASSEASEGVAVAFTTKANEPSEAVCWHQRDAVLLPTPRLLPPSIGAPDKAEAPPTLPSIAKPTPHAEAIDVANGSDTNEEAK